MTHALEVLHTKPYSGTIYCNWLKPPLRITTPTLTLYWVVLKIKSCVLMTLL